MKNYVKIWLIIAACVLLNSVTKAQNILFDNGVKATAPLPVANGGTGATTTIGGLNTLLPAQTAQAAKVLTTNGTNATWQPIAVPTFDATIDFSVNANPNTAGTTFNPNTAANTNVLYVSTIDGSQWTYNGTAYISAPVSSDWKTTGNASTVQATNFIGTTDNVGLSFRTNNVIRQTIDNAGNIGIGTTTPFGKLQVALSSQNASPNAWNANIAVFGQPGVGGSALGIGYDLASNESWISTLAPNIAWRPLRFHGSSWKFVVSGNTETFSIANNNNVGVNRPSPVSRLDVNGSQSSTLFSTAVSMTLSEQRFIIVTAASVLTLPTASTCLGRTYTINARSIGVTISSYRDLSGSVQVTIPISTSITIVSDGTNWQRID